MSDQREPFVRSLREALAPWQMSPTDAVLQTLYQHYEALIAANKVMNITRITEPNQAAVKHYADSLATVAWARKLSFEPSTILDVGTGGGLPAVPIAAWKPDWAVTAIDSTRKKIAFLSDIASEVGLANLRCVHERAEHWRPEATFDLVLAKAVAPLEKVLEKCAHLVSTGGYLVVYQTARETKAADEVARKIDPSSELHATDTFLYSLTLGKDTLHRALHVFARRLR